MDKRWKVIFSFVVVFVAGAVVGGLYSPWQREPKPKKWRERIKQGERGREQFSDRVVRHYTERLSLTPEQIDQIRPIVVAAGKEMRKIRSDWSSNTATVAQEMNQAVAAVLTPEQRVEFEEHIQEMQTRMGRMMGGMRRRGMEGGPPRPPPPPE